MVFLLAPAALAASLTVTRPRHPFVHPFPPDFNEGVLARYCQRKRLESPGHRKKTPINHQVNNGEAEFLGLKGRKTRNNPL